MHPAPIGKVVPRHPKVEPDEKRRRRRGGLV